jgi:hypothetical protein
MWNLSAVSNAETARTCSECAERRAENLMLLGVQHVLELCVGPSLPVLERTYAKFGIQVTGNDIDRRWKSAYPRGKWLIGDALTLDYSQFDAVVFAPPLSRGCTGRREDSLSILEVRPSYLDFLQRVSQVKRVAVLVLPGRSLATREDREQFFYLQSQLPQPFEVIPLCAGQRQIVKYYDVYLKGTYE